MNKPVTLEMAKVALSSAAPRSYDQGRFKKEDVIKQAVDSMKVAMAKAREEGVRAEASSC